jgi:UDP-glucuronate decarboxylase
VDIKVVRIFNTYGPRMAVDDGRVISNFIVQALMAQPLTIYGDGSQTRAFCYVSDLVEGLISMMEADSLIGPINLGNPEEHTILELAEIIIQLSKSSSKITRKPIPPDDPPRRCPEISKAKDKLDWKPKVGLEEGLMKTIHYFREKLGQA